MHFRNPEILFALFFLIIPIIVHLFQLQRFKKTPFTNVTLLKSIKQQSRKSERLKKWMILASRLGIMTFLILAFAGPEMSDPTRRRPSEIHVIIDNSYSMQAKGANGEMLKNTAMKLVENLSPGNSNYSLVTTDDFYEKINLNSLKELLISLDYSSEIFDLSTGLMKLNSKIIDSINSSDVIILITDLQDNKVINKSLFTNVNSDIFTIIQRPEVRQNFFIDSVFIKERSVDQIQLNVVLKSTLDNENIVPVSLADGANLIGKASAYFGGSNQAEVLFSIPLKNEIIGKISIDDSYLDFDNNFYFTIIDSGKRNVLSIGKNSPSLYAIYNDPVFDFSQVDIKNLDYSKIASQDLIILNELEEIPQAIIPELVEFMDNSGDLLVIPSQNSAIPGYNRLLNALELGGITSKIEAKRYINNIHFDHALFNQVFEKRISNFEYPYVNSYFNTQLQGLLPVLSFDNEMPFATSGKVKNGQFYWVSAPISAENSDFYKSPLVVPFLYNIGKYSWNLDKLYYTIGENEQLSIKSNLVKDEVLHVVNGQNDIIPEQRIYNNKVAINLSDQFKKQGVYEIKLNDSLVHTIALNYNRTESILNYKDPESIRTENDRMTVLGSLDDLFTEIDEQRKMNDLFKWFLMLSVLFLLIEILILKYYK